jgi:hypothetical protein
LSTIERLFLSALDESILLKWGFVVVEIKGISWFALTDSPGFWRLGGWGTHQGPISNNQCPRKVADQKGG